MNNNGGAPEDFGALPPLFSGKQKGKGETEMRMRFRKDEREAFTTGAVIEWRNGRHWHPGVVHDGTVVNDPYGSGFQHILIKNTARTGTGVLHGEVMHGSPTSVRLPQQGS